MKFLILSAIFFVVSHCDSVVRTITLTGNEDLSKVLEETMPKKCTKNGKEYSEGESFEQGHLRYKCQKYGVYTIEGCKSDKGAVMGIGEKLVEGNIASQCFKKGNSVSFRETMCGTLGMPDCDKINQDVNELKNYTNVSSTKTDSHELYDDMDKSKSVKEKDNMNKLPEELPDKNRGAVSNSVVNKNRMGKVISLVENQQTDEIETMETPQTAQSHKEANFNMLPKRKVTTVSLNRSRNEEEFKKIVDDRRKTDVSENSTIAIEHTKRPPNSRRKIIIRKEMNTDIRETMEKPIVNRNQIPTGAVSSKPKNVGKKRKSSSEFPLTTGVVKDMNAKGTVELLFDKDSINSKDKHHSASMNKGKEIRKIISKGKRNNMPMTPPVIATSSTLVKNNGEHTADGKPTDLAEKTVKRKSFRRKQVVRKEENIGTIDLKDDKTVLQEKKVSTGKKIVATTAMPRRVSNHETMRQEPNLHAEKTEPKASIKIKTKHRTQSNHSIMDKVEKLTDTPEVSGKSLNSRKPGLKEVTAEKPTLTKSANNLKIQKKMKADLKTKQSPSLDKNSNKPLKKDKSFAQKGTGSFILESEKTENSKTIGTFPNKESKKVIGVEEKRKLPKTKKETMIKQVSTVASVKSTSNAKANMNSDIILRSNKINLSTPPKKGTGENPDVTIKNRMQVKSSSHFEKLSNEETKRKGILPTTHEISDQSDIVDVVKNKKRTMTKHTRNRRNYIYSNTSSHYAKDPDTPLMGGTGEMESHSMTRTITTNGKGTKEVTGSQVGVQIRQLLDEQLGTRKVARNGSRLRIEKEITILEIEGLPPGWRIVDSKGVNVPLDNVRVISRTMMFQQP